MPSMKDFVQAADWKKEKHVPVIDAPDTFKKGEFTKVAVSVGKEIPHPNTTEHHIRWIAVYFIADGDKFPFQIAKSDFTSHGESAQGPNMSTIFTGADMTASFKTDKPGIIVATSYCNIHGLWESSKGISII